ncbi:MAG: ATP-binding protein [bacterium]
MVETGGRKSGHHPPRRDADSGAGNLPRASIPFSLEASSGLMFQQIVDIGTRLVGARYGAIGILNEDGDTIARFFTTGIDEKMRGEIGFLPAGKGILGVPMREPAPLRLKEVGQDPRSAGFPDHHPIMHSFLGVPLYSQGKVYGSLYFTEKQGEDEFSPEDEKLAESFAALAVAAIEREAVHEKALQNQKLEALGRLSSGVAHDFNNALGIIHGGAEVLERLLKKKDADSDTLEYLDIIQKSAMSAAHTVKRLQDFARKREDRPLGWADVNNVIRDAAEMTKPQWQSEAEARGITVDMALRPNAAHSIVNGDEAELQEILINLIINSLDAMPAGGRITISSEDTPEGPRLSVRDTGGGMPPNVRERAFEPFFSTKGEEGTGMGLSMVFGIVTRYGGAIDIESAEGAGTTVSFTLPASDTRKAPEPTGGETSSGPARILLVEDERDMARILQELLEEGGYTVEIARTGNEAIEAFSGDAFDLVITDLGVPGLPGTEVAQRIKTMSRDVPVILLSGWQTEMTPGKMAEAGIDLVVGKPVRKDDLHRAVAGILKNRRKT